jgi:hypothetical protein
MKRFIFAALACLGLLVALVPTAIGGAPKILILEHYGDCC